MMNPQVSIIGAGPTGLLAAITLVKAGVKIRIFEKLETRVIYSKALAVHAGTLELLEKVHPDLLAKFLARGKKIQHMRFGKKYQIDISIIPSKYNCILLLEQEETEEILEKYLMNLGCKVERGCDIVDAKISDEKITTIIKASDGSQENVESDYLLDCSGAHSIIRKNILKLGFKGEKYFGKLVMADIKVKSDLPQDSGFITGNENGFMGFIPINHPGFFRAIIMPKINVEIPQKITIEFFHSLAKKMAPEIELSDETLWLTTFEISKRLASKLRVGRIFLLGDAAHIHSPVGGQGMNLGMQDALNISMKLKRVLIDGVDAKLLDLYEKQRMPIIKQVLKTTNAAMRSGFEKTFLSSISYIFMQKIVAPIFFRSKFLQKKLAITISQIKSARKEIEWMK
jgi:2-polyprenyl-6-methoxyphenol hydroxylase-like FAD-dependent oxidoreductase